MKKVINSKTFTRLLSLVMSLALVLACGVTALADGKIVINDGVTEIPKMAYYERTMTEAVLPDTVKSIGELAFAWCMKLESINLPEGLESIGDEAFLMCANLKSITIPGTLEKMGVGAFDGCEALSSVTIEEGVKELSKGAFSNTSITEITIPGSVQTIGEGAFRGCEKLTDVTIKYGVKTIDTEAFCGFNKLTTLRIPASVTKLGERVFFYCWDLTSLYIPPTVTEIGPLGHDEAALEPIDFTIYGVKGSYAETFALENEYNFVEYDFCPEGHTYSEEYVIQKEPDCVNAGSKYRECMACGDRIDETEIPALDHEYSEEYTVDLEPTVLYAGSKSRHCVRCEATIDVTEIPMIEYEKSFADVDEDDWYHDAVLYASHRELFNGVSPTSFAPNLKMSRAMLVTVLYRLEGEPELFPLPESMDVNFDDVEESDYFYKAVKWAGRYQIVNGVSKTSFAPEADITREQMATILYRYNTRFGNGGSDVRGELSDFADVGTVSNYAKDAMSWSVGSGLINGLTKAEGLCLDPLGGATRAQVATILMRYLLPVLNEQ